jgi:hypothetical protein
MSMRQQEQSIRKRQLLLLQEQGPRGRSVVRFADFDDVSEITHIFDMTQKEIDAVWISRDEHFAIRRQCRDIVLTLLEQAASSGANKEAIVCPRGLDQHMPASTTKQAATRLQMYDSIEAIQSFGIETALDTTPSLIAKLCQKISAPSVSAARSLGRSDESDARQAIIRLFRLRRPRKSSFSKSVKKGKRSLDTSSFKAEGGTHFCLETKDHR